MSSMLSPNARRRVLGAVIAAAGAVAALTPATAGAKILELGETATPPAPGCPEDCKAISRTTGYQVNVGTTRDLFVAPKDGRIVAWTVILGEPTKNQTNFFNSNFGGDPRAGITVLAQQEKGSTLNQVVANSGVRKLTDYMGQRVQFPLVETLPIEKGQRVALTVPTWAPAFAEGFDNKTAWRASRTKNQCNDFATQTALLAVDLEARFQCFYPTARITYSVTMITEPHGPRKKKNKKKDKPADSAQRSASASGASGASGA
jgi:hypothetical protein